MKPTMPAPGVAQPSSEGATSRAWRAAMECLRPYGKRVIFVGLLLLAGTALNLLPPLLVRDLIDRGIPAGQASDSALPIVPHVIGLALLAFAASLVGFVQQYLSTRIGLGVLSDLRQRLFHHWQAQSLGFYKSTPAGELSARMGNDVSRVGFALAEVLPMFLSLGVTLAGTLIILTIISWPLALAACSTLPLFVLLARRMADERRGIAVQVQEAHASLLSLLHQVLNPGGYMAMVLFNRGAAEAQRFAALDAEQNRLQLRLLLSARRTEIGLAVLVALNSALVYCYGGWLVIQGQISLGAVIAFIGYMAALYGPLTRLSDIYGYLHETLGVLQLVFTELDQTPDITDRPGAIPLPPIEGEVRFEKVTFAYSPDQPPVLRDLSFVIPPGKFVALVGPSGAGKSTAIALIPRFYDPVQGCVRIDGFDVREVTRVSLVAQIGLIPQEPYLFNTSIRANLLDACPAATETDLEAACRAAQIHDTIMRLPKGYDSVVGEQGTKLSRGERQRLALARILLQKPRLLVLDEATNSLDADAEQALQA
ncbi:MAG: ABC transporter ATP-binding protein, partial [Alphaproteobacteria bacterium]|nr:ABC transporter ATP-binding protein [Alphaproteobacteria bacterium]